MAYKVAFFLLDIELKYGDEIFIIINIRGTTLGENYIIIRINRLSITPN